MAQTGVQCMLAFVLALAFTPRFAELNAGQLHLYLATLVLGTLAASFLMAPAALNRVVFRNHLRRRLVNTASRFALLGLTFLLAAIGCAIMLVLQVVVRSPWWSAALTAGVVGWFGFAWFAIPAWWRFRHRECGSDADGAEADAGQEASPEPQPSPEPEPSPEPDHAPVVLLPVRPTAAETAARTPTLGSRLRQRPAPFLSDRRAA